MGLSTGSCSWSQEFSGRKLSRGNMGMRHWCTEGRLTVWLGSRTEKGLTRQELVWPVPLLLTVMQCPQIDDDACALVNGKLANAAPERERKGESKTLPSPNCPAPRLHSPSLGEKALYILMSPPSSFPQLLPDHI